jgi:tetratricopeptide (TPR) repeat protein
MRDLLKLAMISVLAIGSIFFAWRLTDSGSGARGRPATPCPPELPAGLDPDRLVVLGYSGPPAGSRQVVFLEDIEELLVSARHSVIPAASQAAALPAHCIGWRIELLAAGPEKLLLLEVRRHGELVESKTEGLGKSPAGAEAILPGIRRAIATRLAIDPAAGDASLHDPQSPAFVERSRAMVHDAEGRRGEATLILQQAVARNPADSALRFRLGRVLVSWAGEMLAASIRPSWQGSPAARRLEGEARQKLDQALIHLDRSLALDNRAALTHFARGQVLAALGRRSAAEVDFALALGLWPAYGESAAELARLRLARGDAYGLEDRLDGALWLLDRRKVGLRAELLLLLGKARLETGRLAAAAEAFQESLLVVPIERRTFRLEALALLAQAQGELGQTVAAEVTWRNHEVLAAASSGSEIGVESDRRAILAE